MHRQQKKKLREELGSLKTRDLTKIVNIIERWVMENYYQELSLVMRGHGKFRFANGYDHFKVDPKTWHQMSPEARDAKVIKFSKFIPKPSQTYSKPVSAGTKGKPSKKRRVGQGEPELFNSRINPIKVKKTSKNWEVCQNCRYTLFSWNALAIIPTVLAP